jgi:hypothetical protein
MFTLQKPSYLQFLKLSFSGCALQGLYFVTAPSMAVLLCRKHVSTGTYHDICSAQDSIKAIPCNYNNKNKKIVMIIIKMMMMILLGLANSQDG